MPFKQAMVAAPLKLFFLLEAISYLSFTRGKKSLFLFPAGPVEIGMSLDIASIDAISEINMVQILDVCIYLQTV